MCSRGVLVHCPRRLGAEVAVLGVELLCVDGISAQWALEHAKALHHCDGVMPHNFKYRRLFQYDSALKLPPHRRTNESRCEVVRRRLLCGDWISYVLLNLRTVNTYLLTHIKFSR